MGLHKGRRRQPGIPSCCPNTRGARGLKIPQQERENHAAGKPRRWRQTTYQGHSQHKPRSPIQKRGPRRSSCLLSSRSRLAERKGEIAAAKDGTARYERRGRRGGYITRPTSAANGRSRGDFSPSSCLAELESRGLLESKGLTTSRGFGSGLRAATVGGSAAPTPASVPLKGH